MLKGLANEHPLRLLCDLFDLPRGTYYYHTLPRPKNTNSVTLIAISTFST